MEFTNLASLGVFSSLDAARALIIKAKDGETKQHKNLMLSSGLKLLDHLLAQVILTKILPFGAKNVPQTVLGSFGLLLQQSASASFDISILQPIYLQCQHIQLDIERCLRQLSPTVTPNSSFSSITKVAEDQISLKPLNLNQSSGQSDPAEIANQLCNRIEILLESMESQIEEY